MAYTNQHQHGRFGFVHYAMPSVPVPPVTLLTDTSMVSRCRLLAAHGARSCLSVRTQPLTATNAPSKTIPPSFFDHYMQSSRTERHRRGLGNADAAANNSTLLMCVMRQQPPARTLLSDLSPKILDRLTKKVLKTSRLL